ncbi:MAG: C69 family dipeptidase [Bacteroidota bacterium]|nr:C69 family dipeptidase [Bacteroidota bacterium]
MVRKISFFVLITLLWMFTNTSQACTDIVVGKKASADGSVIISHTDSGDDCRLRVVHGQKFPEGAMASVYWGIQDVKLALDDFGEVLGKIPQVRETYTYFHSAYSQMNEHQLAIGESTTSMRDELKFDRKEAKQIMTIEQAQIFALQRCKTSREAVELIGFLMEKYGFLPSCVGESETLSIGDPNEAWIFEVFSVGGDWDPESGKPGCVWAAQRVPDDHALIIPNWSIIKEIDLGKPDVFMASSNYKSFAIEKGYYDPASGMPFIWQKAYAPILREWATSRFWLFYSTIAPNYCNWPNRKLKSPFGGMNPYIQYVEDVDIYPFSVKPEKKLSVQDVMAFQRSTMPGTIYDQTSDPDWYIPKDSIMVKSPLTTPFPTKAMRQLLDINHRRNISRGGYGMVAQLRSWLPNAVGGIYWFYTDNQYTAAYVPIYAGTQEIAACYKVYDPDKYDEKSIRWAFDFVDNLCYLRWQDAIKDVREVRNPVEKRFFDEIAAVDKEYQKLAKHSSRKANKYLTELTQTRMNEIYDIYIELKKTLITKYTNNKQGS